MPVAFLGRLTFEIGVTINRSRDTEAGVPGLARIVSRSQFISIRAGSYGRFDAYAGVRRRIGRPPIAELLVTDLRRFAFGICMTENILGTFCFPFLPQGTTRARE